MPCPSCTLTDHEDFFAVRRHRHGRDRGLLSALAVASPGRFNLAAAPCGGQSGAVRVVVDFARCGLGAGIRGLRRGVHRCSHRVVVGSRWCPTFSLGCDRCGGGCVGDGDHCVPAALTSSAATSFARGGRFAVK